MEPPTQLDVERLPEHAFGKIHQITVPIKWAPTPKNARRKVRNFVDATTETWSVNGVGFTCATDPEVKVDAILTISIGPVTGECVVMTVAPTGRDGSTYYGVELIGDDLQNVARDLISIHLRHHPEIRKGAGSPLDQEDPNQVHMKDWT